MGALDIATGNIDADPLFASPGSYGAPADLALLPGSPSIDAGNPAPGGLVADFLGSPRPLDGDGDGAAVRDQGAFEAPGMPGPPQPAGATPDTSVTVKLLGRRLRVSRRGIARLRLRWPAGEQSPPCSGVLVLRTFVRSHGAARSARGRRVVLARARFRIGAGRVRAVRLRVRGYRLRLLRSGRASRRVLAIARVRDASGTRRTVRKRLRAAL